MPASRRSSSVPALVALVVGLALALLLGSCAVPVHGMNDGMNGGMNGGGMGRGSGRMPGTQGMHGMHALRTCPTSPPQHGTVVRVHLTDMGGGAMMGSAAVMRLMAWPAVVPQGEVTFVATNMGRRTHELVVLPLQGANGARRHVDARGTISEQGALGEASAPCAAGAGEGLKPGTTGWVTLALRPGRYELVCNEPHHYARGMHAVLIVR